MTSRKAFSLVELMTVVAITGIVMSLVSATFVTLYELDASARREMELGDTLSALELQLRQDVHNAHHASVNGDALEFGGKQSTIKWTAGSEEMTREVQSEGEVTERERWLLPANYQAEWSVEQAGASEWVKLQLVDERHTVAKRRVVVQCRAGANLPAQEAQP